MGRYLFYSIDSETFRYRNLALPPGLRFRLWRPSAASLFPPGLSGKAFPVWWFFHQVRLFANDGYAVAVVYQGQRPVHHSCVFPRYFRFPFMGDQDLQIGDIWTDPGFRGQGIASVVLNDLLSCAGATGRRFWYITESSNRSSVRLAEGAGLALRGEGARTRRFGSRALGSFRLDPPA